MSLERKDICSKVDADVHRALKRICDVRGLTIGEFIEKLVVPEVVRIVHEAKLIAEDSPDLGKNGNGRE